MRLIDADALLKTFAEKGIRYSVDMHNAIIDAKTPVTFICDGRACPSDCMECQHTTDITHAENFINKNGRYIEKVRTGRWTEGSDARPTGQWLPRKAEGWKGGGVTFCSCCGAGYAWGEFYKVNTFNYCPNCGTRMEE